MRSVAEAYKDFPILKKEHKGHRIVYLDSGATTQMPEAVLNALHKHLTEHNGNPHRGAHVLAVEASEAYETTRDAVQRFINAKEREEIVLTRNTTESLNLIAFSYGLHNLKKGDKIVIPVSEHHANLVTWQRVAQVTGAILEFMYLDESGHLKPGEMDKIDNTTKIVSFAHISNVLGMEFPVEELIKRAHAVGAIAILDGAQSAPHKKIDVQALDCDFFVFSGHKMCASQGIGVMYGKRHLLEEMPPFLLGGDMIEYVQEQSTTYNEVPYKFEAGTPNAHGAVTLKAAIEYLEEFGMDNINAYEKELVNYVLPKLLEIPHVHVLGSEDPAEKHGVIAFTIDDVHPHDVATILDSKGVCIRSGHHCAQPLGAYYNVPASNRLSMYVYTRKEDLDIFLEAVKTVRPTMGLKD
ncbi:SufS family cysteine desulfurase [uncultured Veillonella sp.]|uniref:SufS family cysteine desulfurase n=1 Tax=uncultured Veillonella sp. TaxID=159268 RepID=UPI0025F63231|nr:SufS family cysteine desulfurase [uncultured Veillonella sp.]MDY3974359.1 SufS family cysteine desulfurase [Veillonella caviae]